MKEADRLCGDLALDEGHGLRAVLVDVLLVSIGVVSGAAVWVSCIAVRLDDAGTGRRALEASWASSELCIMLANHYHVSKRRLTPCVVQVPTLYGSPARLCGSPMKIAALTAFNASPVSVAPAPPQRALSII